MSRVKNRSDQKDRVIKFLTVLCIFLGGLLAHSHIQVLSVPEDLNCYIPPTIAGGGKLQKEMPKQSAYAFAREINQQLRRCSEDCSEEFEENIRRYSQFITPSYKAILLREAATNKSRNRDRVRYVSEVGGFDWDKVELQKDGSYLVKLKVNEVEYIGTQKVRDAIMEYPFIIRFGDVDRQKNPWKLQIDGTKGNPLRMYDEEKNK